MSRLHLATSLEALAERWLKNSQSESKERSGPLDLTPQRLFAPNRNLWRWLQLRAADELGVAFNIRFSLLERGLWNLLEEIDPARPARLELLDHGQYRLMVLALFLEQTQDLPGVFQRYLGDPADAAYPRKAWQLADRLARLIRDYEYHRQDMIQHWLRSERSLANAASATAREMEDAQARLFHIFAQPGGLRDRWGEKSGVRFATLPQYANEVRERLEGQTRKLEAQATVHIFGLSLISSYHVDLLAWLTGWHDLQLYHFVPQAEAFAGLRGKVVATKMNSLAGRPGDDDDSPAALWGHAGRESLKLLRRLIAESKNLSVEAVPATAAQPLSVLDHVQAHLRGANEPTLKLAAPDASLQVLAAPSPRREVESVYQCILENLRTNPDLQLHEIAVLVADMPAYRSTIASVFGRLPRRITYNLSDFPAAEQSAFGRAFMGLLDLASTPFRREEVFETLLNPCVLARFRTARPDALVWLEWTRKLGVFHALDAENKRELAYGDGLLYTWQQALQRLRLGHVLDLSPERPGDPPGHYKSLVPFRDLESSGGEALGAFSEVLEALRIHLKPLRTLSDSGAAWRARLQKISEALLDCPSDRPDEAELRLSLMGRLGDLDQLDRLAQAQGQPHARLTLPLVRELLRERLGEIEGAQGTYLAGGVTISAFRPLRPIPFKLIFVLGLGERVFPGPEMVSTLDLRRFDSQLGDVSGPDANRYLFVESLLAARAKVYLSYVERDLQKDESLNPSPLISALLHYVNGHILSAPQEPVHLPLSAHDATLLPSPAGSKSSETLITHEPADRLLAFADPSQRARLNLSPALEKFAEARLAERRFPFPPPPTREKQALAAPRVTLRELSEFIINPALASIRRHLRLSKEYVFEPPENEPFYSSKNDQDRLVTTTLRSYIDRMTRAATTKTVAHSFKELFQAHYESARREGRAPDGAYALLDEARILDSIGFTSNDESILLPTLRDFLNVRAHAEYFPRVIIGEDAFARESGAHLQALRLAASNDPQADPLAILVGGLPLVWRTKAELEILLLTPNYKPDLQIPNKLLIEPLLFFYALRALETEPQSGQDPWLGDRTLAVHFLHSAGLYTQNHASCTPRVARDYLLELLNDYLNPNSFDLLPFTVFWEWKKNGGDIDPNISTEFPALFREAIEADRAAQVSKYYPSDLEIFAEPQVPADAWDKLKRRYAPINRVFDSAKQVGLSEVKR